MIGVYEDDLVVLVYTILVDPIRVQHTQVPAPPTNTLLRHTPQATLELEVVDTLVNGFAVGSTFASENQLDLSRLKR